MTAPPAARAAYHTAIGQQPGQIVNWPLLDQALDAAFEAAGRSPLEIQLAPETVIAAAAQAERERCARLAERFEHAFREYVDHDEAADCALRAAEIIRSQP